MDGRLRLAFVAALVGLAGLSATTGAAVAADAAQGSRISIVVVPTSRSQGVSLFRIVVSGYAAELRTGAYRRSRQVLFIFPGQTKRCAVDQYGEGKLQSDGQGYQYSVGPGSFSVVVTGYARNSWRFGHVCAYLVPLNLGMADRGGIPLGPVTTRAQVTINVAHPAKPGL